jgi:uncharacterized protein YegL
MVDESAAVARFAAAIDAGIADLYQALVNEPAATAGLRLAVLPFGDQVRAATPLSPIVHGSAPRALVPAGPADYASVFADLLQRIPQDVDQLKQVVGRVNRPVVYLLGASPGNVASWADLRRQLTDRQVVRAAPTIVACGVGAATAEVVAAIASQPEFALIALPGVGADSAIAAFWRSVATSMLASGAALARGESSLSIKRPDGFAVAGAEARP